METSERESSKSDGSRNNAKSSKSDGSRNNAKSSKSDGSRNHAKSCKHENIQEKTESKVTKPFKGWLAPCKVVYVDVECLDCKTEFRIEKTIGRLTGHAYQSGKRIYEFNCDHKQLDVNQQSRKTKYVRKTTLGGVLLRMFVLVGGWGQDVDMVNVQYAKAQCQRCRKNLIVERILKQNKEPSQWTIANGVANFENL